MDGFEPAIRTARQGRREVSKFRSESRDDKNDSRLFERMQEYVIEHYPNPQRLNCLDRDVLRRLVENPEQIDLSDSTLLHVFKCAECTRDLCELRRARAARQRPTQPAARSSDPTETGSPIGAKISALAVRIWKKLKLVLRFPAP